MSWVTVGVAAAGATSGYLKGKRNEKTKEENDKFRKAAIQYSPWTKLSDPGASPSGPGGMEAAIGGGLQGAAMGSMIGKGIGAAGAPAAGSGALGSDMAMSGAGVPGMTTSGMPMATPNAFGQDALSIDSIGGDALAAGNTPGMENLGGQKYSKLLQMLGGQTSIS